MASEFDITRWYWSVLDSAPGAQVYSSAANGFVPLADATYVAWLAADGGNTPTTIDTFVNLTKVLNINSLGQFRQGLVNAGVMTSTVTLTNPPPAWFTGQPTVVDRIVVLPVMNTPNSLPIGEIMVFLNIGPKNLLIQDSAFNNLQLLPASWIAVLTLVDNSLSTGNFRIYTLPQSGYVLGQLSVLGRAVNTFGSMAEIAATAGSDAVLKESGGTIIWGPVNTVNIANDQVSDAKLRNSSALSVIGRAANSVGDPGDIVVAAASDKVLVERSSGVSWEKLTKANMDTAFYDEGTWTPVPAFATPGTSSIITSTANGRWTRIGRKYFCEFDFTTSTFTLGTASGNFQVSGLPVASNGTIRGGGVLFQADGFTAFNAATLNQLAPRVELSSQFFLLRQLGTTTGAAATVANFTSGTNLTMRGYVEYTV